MLRKDEILLELEEFLELPDFMLSLLVSARFRAVNGLKVVELMRLELGEGVPDLDPSSCRVIRRCSCLVRSACFSSILCLFRVFLSRSAWATSSAKLICGSSLYLFYKQFGFSLLQGLGFTPAATISAKVGDRGRGVEFRTF